MLSALGKTLFLQVSFLISTLQYPKKSLGTLLPYPKIKGMTPFKFLISHNFDPV